MSNLNLINFLQIYLRNASSAKQIGCLIVIIFATFAIERIIALLLTKYLKKASKNAEVDFQKGDINSACLPTSCFIWLLGINIFLGSMNLTSSPYVKGPMSILLIFFATWLIFSAINISGELFFKKYNTADKDTLILQFFPLINKVLKALIVFIAVIIAMQVNGYSAASLLTGFGVLGMAVGIAAKETIANFFGSFAVVMDNVYKHGDLICIDKTMNGANVEGFVEEINLRSTKIRALDDTLMIIPNNIMANIAIKNISRQNKKLLNESFEIALEVEPEQLEQGVDACKRILAANSGICGGFQVTLNKINSITCQINLFAFAKTNDNAEFLKLKHELLLSIFKEFKQMGIYDYVSLEQFHN